MLAGERGIPLLTLSGIALKLTGVYGVIQGKYHTFERNATWRLRGARSKSLRGHNRCFFANPKILSVSLNWQMAG